MTEDEVRARFVAFMGERDQVGNEVAAMDAAMRLIERLETKNRHQLQALELVRNNTITALVWAEVEFPEWIKSPSPSRGEGETTVNDEE